MTISFNQEEELKLLSHLANNNAMVLILSYPHGVIIKADPVKYIRQATKLYKEGMSVAEYDKTLKEHAYLRVDPHRLAGNLHSVYKMSTRTAYNTRLPMSEALLAIVSGRTDVFNLGYTLGDLEVDSTWEVSERAEMLRRVYDEVFNVWDLHPKAQEAVAQAHSDTKESYRNDVTWLMLNELRKAMEYPCDNLLFDKYTASIIDYDKENTKVSVFRNYKDALLGKLTTMNLGKWLVHNHTCPYTLDHRELEIESMSGLDPWVGHVVNTLKTRLVYLDNIEVQFTTNSDEAEHVYRNGPNSCMSGVVTDIGYHPARVYDGTDTSIAYIEIDDRIVARAVVSNKNKEFVGGYGNCTILHAALEKLGYTQNSNALEDHKLALIEYQSGFLLPYLDGHYDCVDKYDDYLLVTNGGEFCADETGGWHPGENQQWCWYNEEYYPESDTTEIRIYDHGWEWVEDDTIHNHFTELHDGNYTSNHSAIECAVDGAYYHESEIVYIDTPHVINGDIYNNCHVCEAAYEESRSLDEEEDERYYG